MKDKFIETLLTIMEGDSDVVFLTADLGFMSLEPLFERFPDRTFNVGIGEANMINMAGGLAKSGKKVFCYSMVPFIVHRSLEQVKIQLACSAYGNIALIGVGAGFTYGPQGSSHHAIEDIGVMRSIPGVKIEAPGTPEEIEEVLKRFVLVGQATYIRIGWSSNNCTQSEIDEINKEKSDTLVLTYGSALGCAVKGIMDAKLPVNLASLCHLIPLDEGVLLAKMKGYKKVFLIEPNIEAGGIVEKLKSLLFDNQLNVEFKHINFLPSYTKIAGNKVFYEDLNGQSPVKISEFLRSHVS